MKSFSRLKNFFEINLLFEQACLAPKCAKVTSNANVDHRTLRRRPYVLHAGMAPGAHTQLSFADFAAPDVTLFKRLCFERRFTRFPDSLVTS